jgi:hypothetical protein
VAGVGGAERAEGGVVWHGVVQCELSGWMSR